MSGCEAGRMVVWEIGGIRGNGGEGGRVGALWGIREGVLMESKGCRGRRGKG